MAEQERRDSTAYVYDKDSQRIFSLHAKGGVFPDIIEHPIMLRLMESILGYNFLLPSSHANIAGPAANAWICTPTRRSRRRPSPGTRWWPAACG